ncbi:MAG: hypothetical protein K1X87_05360 [Dehalococcoidia bacterium]|nr:hypothetical protein [Dehalococcoidia bacterium]
MRRGAPFAVAIVLLALLPAVAAAQRPEIVARAAVDRTDVGLGERIRITITAQHPDSVLIDVLPPEDSSTLRVVEKPPPTTTPGKRGGPSVTQFAFVVAAFSLGPQQLPPMRLTWIDDNGVSGEQAVEAPAFTVASTVAPGDTELRPLKPQLSIEGAPVAWQLPAAIGGALLVLAIGVGGGLLARHRRPTAIRVAAPEPALTMEDAARKRLETMAAAHPLAAGDYDAYYGTISGVVRGYLEERFAFRATALTTPELERRMTGQGVERWQARLVGGLLDRCDAAVYAGRRPDPASADHDLTVAFEIIELSRPQAEPASAEALP